MTFIEGAFGHPLNRLPIDNTSAINLGIIGTSTAGKTYLVNAINYLTLNGKLNLKNNLWISVESGFDVARRTDDLDKFIEYIKRRAFPFTVEPEDFTFSLLDTDNSVCDIVYHDSVGQILTDADPKKNPSRKEFIKTISQGAIVWLLIPMQVDKDGEYCGIKMKDAMLAKAYLLDVLRDRPKNLPPIAVAIVLTKADVLNDLESDKNSKNKLNETIKDIKEQFNPLINSNNISVVALFPISAIGFDNAKFTPSNEAEHLPSTFTLAGHTIKPYNVDKLLLWSLAYFMYQSTHNDTPIDGNIKQGILQSLQELNGLMYPLKGGS